MGFFVVPVAFTRSVFRPSDAARLPIPQLRGYSILAATTPPCFAHPGAAFPRSDNSARSRNPDRAQTRAGTRTSAARSRFRPPRPVRRSSRLRLRRQSLHTATTRQPVTSNPITARKAVASPAATATDQTRPDQTRPEPEPGPNAGPPLHTAASGPHDPSASPPASAFVGSPCTQQPSAGP